MGFADVSELTAEECDLVSGYCSYVKREAKGNDKVLYIEHLVSLEAYVDDMFGSIDAVIVGNDEVHVIDLKTGARSVSAESNPQLMAYLLGAVNAYEMWEAEMFKMTIWQGGEADTVTVSLSELNEFAKKLMASASIALQENAPRNPSDDACRYCKAQVECPALYQQQLTVVGGDFEDLTDPSKLTDEQIATVVLNRSRVEKWMKAVWSHAIERHRLGDAVEGVKVVGAEAPDAGLRRVKRRWLNC